MLARNAAPPKRAAAPIAAVCLGTPAVAAVPLAAVPVAVALRVAVAAAAEVKGTAVPLEAPEKPGEPAVPVGVAVLLPGFKTLLKRIALVLNVDSKRTSSWQRYNNLLVNNVGHTVGNENVRDNDLGRVKEDVAVANGNLDRASLEGGNGLSILQGATVADSTVNDVVLQDRGELLSGQGGNQVVNGGESAVLRGKDGNILDFQVSF